MGWLGVATLATLVALVAIVLLVRRGVRSGRLRAGRRRGGGAGFPFWRTFAVWRIFRK